MAHSKDRRVVPHQALLIALLTSTALAGAPALAQSLPTGGTVAAGSASIGPQSNGTLTINQTSANAVINWQSFNIGQGNAVTFVQPDARSAILNRVTGATSSSIAGSLTANGQVYLINPNGIAITATGTVNSGAFVASTLAISDADFMAGKRSFTGTGASNAVSNAGTLTIERGGYLALIGGSVDNSGSISVPMGKVALGSGEQATLDLAGDGFLQVAIPTNGQGSDALVSNSGTISANGGMVQLTAAAARAMARQAVNMSGTVEARGVSGRSGDITLFGGEGKVVVTGRVQASNATGKGGSVTVASREIELASARIDASGQTGGGIIRIGGDRQGQGPLQHAETLSVDADTVIKADALVSGDGGDVVLWSDLFTGFAGTLSATGGALSGNGGEAEVSGKAKLAYTGFTDLSAPNGAFGTLLLDPYNVTIVPGAAGAITPPDFTAGADDTILGADTLLAALDTANVTVWTGWADTSPGLQPGNLTVSADLSWLSNTTLTLKAAGTITLDNSITAPAGGLALYGGSTISANGAIDVAHFGLAIGNWVQNTAVLLAFAADDFGLYGGSFLRATGGDGTTASPYALADIYGLQGINSLQWLNFTLAADVDASVTATWHGGAGFVPVPTFTGNFDGAGHTISGLVINRPNYDLVGLFGYVGSASTVRNVGLLGGSVIGHENVGSLVGYNDGTVLQSYATGTVEGHYRMIGGLVGRNRGTVTQSHAAGAVTGIRGSNVGVYSASVGGLVGWNDGGTILQSYATGTATNLHGDSVGGLAGRNAGGSTIKQSYATGAVIGWRYAGGLVGVNDGGTIEQAYATGAVTGDAYVGGIAGSAFGSARQVYAVGTISGSYYAGGLFGLSGVVVDQSYWNYETTGKSEGYGDEGYGFEATGLTTAQMQDMDNYQWQYGGWDFVNVWSPPNQVGQNNGSDTAYYPQLYALANVTTVDPNGSRHYGAANSTVPINYYGVQAGDTVTTPATRTGDPAVTAAAGTSASVAVSGAFTTSASGNTYRYVYLPGTIEVSRAPLTITAHDASKDYGQTVSFAGTEFTASALQNGESITSVTLASDSAVATANALDYAITASAVSGTLDPNNYAITYIDGSLMVNRAPLTITISDTSKTYGQTLGFAGTEFTTSALQNGERVAWVALTSAGAGAAANVAGTPYAITGSGANGGGGPFNPNNYTISYVDGQLAVTPAAMTITANSIGKTYGQTVTLNGTEFTATGLQNGQSIDSLLLASLGAAPTAGVTDAPYAIEASGASGTFDPNNYTIGYVNGQLTVSPAAMTITANAASKVYGETITYNGTEFTAAGLQNSESVDSVTLTSNGVAANGYAGWYYIVASDASGTFNPANYTTTYVDNIITVYKAPLTITLHDATFTYGELYLFDGTGFTASAFQNGESLDKLYIWSLDRINQMSAGLDGGVTGSPYVLQTYGIMAQSNGFYSNNYAINYVPGYLTILPATLTVTANAATKIYGAADPALTYTASGLVWGDTVDTVLSGALARTLGENVGDYAIDRGNLASNANYTIAYADANFDITPATLTLATAGRVQASRTYDGTTDISVITQGSLAGTINGDSVDLSLAAAYADKNAGTGKAVNGLYTLTGGGAGNYRLDSSAFSATADITQAALTLATAGTVQSSRAYDGTTDISVLTDGTLAGIVSGDAIGLMLTADYADKNAGLGKGVSGLYTLMGAGAGNYTLGSDSFSTTADITQASLTITANDASKVYGQTVTFGGSEFTASGLQHGESLGSVMLASAGAAATANVAGSPYAITVGGASGGTVDLANYTIGYVGGHLTMIPRGLIVTVDGQSRIYGEVNPALNYTVGGLGLVNSDTLAGLLSTSATQYSDVGAYAITQGSLTASGNYAVSFLPGALTVRAANPGPGTQASFVAMAGNTGGFTPFLPVSSATTPTADGSGILLTDPRFDNTVVCLDSGADCVAVPPQG